MRVPTIKDVLKVGSLLLATAPIQSVIGQSTLPPETLQTPSLITPSLVTPSEDASLYRPMRESMRGNFDTPEDGVTGSREIAPALDYTDEATDPDFSFAVPSNPGSRIANDREDRIAIDSYQQTDWTLGVRGDLDHSSNLFGAVDGEEESGLYGEAALILSYAYGDRKNREENFVAFTYEPGISWFGENVGGSTTHFDHRAAFEGRITRSRTFAEADLKLDRVRETFAAIGTRVERLSSHGDLEIGYKITPKVDLALTGHFIDHQFDDEFVTSALGNLYDSTTYGFGAALIYHPDPKLEYRVHAYTGRVDVEDFPEGFLCEDGSNSPSQDYIGLTFGGRYQITPYVSGEFTVGVENWDQDGNSDSTNPVGEIALAYNPSERNLMRLGLGYGTRPSPYIVGANTSTLHFSFLGEKSVGKAVTAGLQADFRALDYDVYHNCEGAPDELSSEGFFTISPFLRYRFTDRLSAELSYTRAEKTSDFSFLEFSENRVGVSVNLEF